MKDEEILEKATHDGCTAVKGKFDKKTKVCSFDGVEVKFDSITGVNFKPHPYMITPRHLEHTSMYLDNSAIERAEKHGVRCGWKDCELPYDKHTHDKAIFLKIKSDKDLKEIKKLPTFLFAIKPMLEEHKIDGVAFVKWESQLPTTKVRGLVTG